MTDTHIEHIHEGTSTDSGMWFFFGIIFLVLFMLILFFYGLPLLKGFINQIQPPYINVPNEFDINLKQK